MLTRRKFLQIFGLSGLAISILPSFLTKKSFSSSPGNLETTVPVRNWLYGSPRRGCSSPDLAWEYHGKAEDGLKNFVSYRFPFHAHIDFV